MIGQTGAISYRVYKWCSDDPTPPCDEMQGNEIIDGGRITFHLNTAYAAGTATIAQGSITSSTDPTYPSGEPVTARVQDYLLTLGFFPDAPFCASNAPPGQCGA